MNHTIISRAPAAHLSNAPLPADALTADTDPVKLGDNAIPASLQALAPDVVATIQAKGAAASLHLTKAAGTAMASVRLDALMFQLELFEEAGE